MEIKFWCDVRLLFLLSLITSMQVFAAQKFPASKIQYLEINLAIMQGKLAVFNDLFNQYSFDPKYTEDENNNFLHSLTKHVLGSPDLDLKNYVEIAKKLVNELAVDKNAVNKDGKKPRDILKDKYSLFRSMNKSKSSEQISLFQELYKLLGGDPIDLKEPTSSTSWYGTTGSSGASSSAKFSFYNLGLLSEESLLEYYQNILVLGKIFDPSENDFKKLYKILSMHTHPDKSVADKQQLTEFQTLINAAKNIVFDKKELKEDYENKLINNFDFSHAKAQLEEYKKILQKIASENKSATQQTSPLTSTSSKQPSTSIALTTEIDKNIKMNTKPSNKEVKRSIQEATGPNLNELKKYVLHVAAEFGNTEILQFALQPGSEFLGSINIQDDGGNTPLHSAVLNNQKDCVQILVNKGANKNIKNKDQKTALMLAQEKKLDEIAKLIDPTATTSIITQEPQQQKEQLQTISDVDMLVALITQGNLPELKKKIDALGYEKMQKLKSGAKGFSLMHQAAFVGNKPVLAFLLENVFAGDPDIVDDEGRTPLHVAAAKNHSRCIDFLIERSASKNKQNKKGNTPLHSAVIAGAEKSVQTLLKHKVKVDIKNNEGKVPLDIAKDKGVAKIVELLGGKQDSFTSKLLSLYQILSDLNSTYESLRKNLSNLQQNLQK